MTTLVACSPRPNRTSPRLHHCRLSSLSAPQRTSPPAIDIDQQAAKGKAGMGDQLADFLARLSEALGSPHFHLIPLTLRGRVDDAYGLTVVPRPICTADGGEFTGVPAACASCGRRGYWLAEVVAYFLSGKICDARAGGLLLSRRHDADHLQMIAQVSPGFFETLGLVHGGEFIVNHRSSAEHHRRLEEINRLPPDGGWDLAHVPLTPHTRVLNTRGSDHDRWVVVDPGQFIANTGATAAHLEELQQINGSGGVADIDGPDVDHCFRGLP